jgi:DNA-binding transcriptional regulator YiaG
MNNTESIIKFLTAGQLKQLRLEAELSSAELAKILDVSPATLEAWESGKRTIQKDSEQIRSIIQKYKSHPILCGNLLFGIIPLKHARNMLKISIDEAAGWFNLSKHTWSSYESNRRVVPKDILEKIEHEVAVLYAELSHLKKSQL